jgi:hypothetical protein
MDSKFSFVKLFERQEFSGVDPRVKEKLSLLYDTMTKSNEPTTDFRPLIQNQLESVGLQYIGEGNSRITFSLNEDFAIKVAFVMEDYGIVELEQNKEEIRAAACTSKFPEFFTGVVEWDTETYFWVVVEKVDIRNQYQNLNRWLRDQIGEAGVDKIEKAGWFNPTEAFREGPVRFHNVLRKVSPWCNRFFAAIDSCQLTVYDLHEENWGMRKDGSWVVLDYGATLNSWKSST